MPPEEESELINRWLATYEPAAEVVVLPHEVVATSTRHSTSVSIARTGDLSTDLTHALANLVDSMS